MAALSSSALIEPRPKEWANAEPIRVLLCEDDPITLKILQKRVSSAGFDVRSAENGLKGLELAREFSPHLVLSDWMMPGMDGVELCSKIRELEGGQSTYFILLTAKDNNDDKIQAFDSGADEYLVKPIDGRELMARLRAAERLVRTQEALAKSYADLSLANKRIEDELHEISNIQLSMLPQKLPQCEGFQFAAHYKPSTECSGDFYDLFKLKDGRLGIVMGDVSGHGAPAMVAMTMVNTLIHMFSDQFTDPAALLYHVNNEMFKHLPTGQYCTLFYGILDKTSGILRYSSAGHPAPVVLERGTKSSRYLDNCEGFPIKLVGPNMEYLNYEMELRRGESLIIYTDGLLEAFSPDDEMYGSDRLDKDVLKGPCDRAEDLIDNTLNQLQAFTQARPLEDDLSLLVVWRD